MLGATGLFLGLKGVIFNDTVLGWFGSNVQDIPVYLQTLTTVLLRYRLCLPRGVYLLVGI
nr:Uncharacterised protein [Raoultella sp. NCTC 9187]